MDLDEALEDIRDRTFLNHDSISIETREQDFEGDQPLHVAVIIGRLDYVKILLDAGADVNSAGDMNCTPLNYATSRGNLEIARCLLDHGADPLSKSDFDRTPLDNCSDEKMRALLLEYV